MNTNIVQLEVKTAARDAFEEVLENRCFNQVQESYRLRFISASAKYLRAVREIEYARDNPSIGSEK
jgi:hypothetical protein